MDLMFLSRDLTTLITWAATDTLLNIAAISGMLMLAARFGGIGVWSLPQFVFMLGYGALVEGLVNLFFGYNVSFISRRLGRGQLDHTLIQPQPLWMSLLTEGFSPAFGLPTMVPGVCMLVWSLVRIHSFALHGVAWAALFTVNLASSVCIVMAFQFAWGSLAFYSPRSAEEINTSTNELIAGLKAFPLNGLSSALQIGLLTILPVGFVAWVPSAVLANVRVGAVGPLTTPLAALLSTVAAGALFKRGLSHYERTGSQGYSPFGHRS